VGRRRFDHFFAELCVAVSRLLPRYELWLALHDEGLDPERVGGEGLLSFLGEPLDAFLAEQDLELPQRARRRLARTIAAFDPSVRTPDEQIARLIDGTG
jgi:hypothetical protein